MHWIIHLEGAPERVNHAAAAVDNKIYSFGGYNSTEGILNNSGYIDIWVLNTNTLRWFPLFYKRLGVGVPFKRYGHTVVAHGHKIYLWGGRNDFISEGDLHCFDVDTHTWSTPSTFGRAPLPSDGHSACIINDFMYVFGGFQVDAERFSTNLNRLNLHTFEWEAVNTFGVPPVGRDFHTASVIGHRMYIFGGRSVTNEETLEQISELYCDKIMYFNTNSMEWVTPETRGDRPCGRRSHSAVVYNDELYIFGGFNGNIQKHFKDVYKFNPVSNHWSLIHCKGKGPCPRRRHCSCIVGNRVYLFGGSSPRPEHADDVIDDEDDWIDDEDDVIDNEDLHLIDHSDLHVLDFFPNLRTLCQLKAIEYQLSITFLPEHLIQEIRNMTRKNITNREHYPRKDHGVFSSSA